MNAHMESTVAGLLASGQGILAADENFSPNCGCRFLRKRGGRARPNFRKQRSLNE
jgi:hypothetical protein